MQLLLDTHSLLWWATDDKRLGGAARQAIAAPANAVFVSAVTIWEVAIKQALGRLRAPDIPELLVEQGFRDLPLTVAHAWAAGALPPIHRDPFDRALVAQATLEGMVLVTADELVMEYGGAVLHATRG